jgi:hypothetical protein
MSIHTTQQNEGSTTETAWQPNSGNNVDDTTTPVQTVADNDSTANKVQQSKNTPQTTTTPLKAPKLKTNSQRVLDIIATQETRNASAAYKQVYPNASDITARSNAYQLLQKPSSQVYLQQHTSKAVENILELANSAKSELVRLNANQDILDRNFGKATIKQEQVSTGVTLVINLTGE